MGFFDRAKKKAEELAEDHGDTIEEGIDKAADAADEKTGGKYSDQIEAEAEKAKDVVEGLGEKDDG